MSSEFFIIPRGAPRRNLAFGGGPLSHPDSIRLYRQSPTDGLLQIRRIKDYVSVSLTSAELRELAAAAIAVADDIEGAGK